MGGLNRRLENLERRKEGRRPLPAREPPTEEQAKERWLAYAKVRRSAATGGGKRREEFHVRDVARVLRPRGEFDGSDLEGFRDRLRQWRPPLDEHAILRVTARMAYDGEPPAQEMQCPPKWRGAFEAAEELLDRYVSADPEIVARIFVAIEVGAEGDDEGRGWMDAEREHLGITEELVALAVGPDAEEIPQEELERRLMEALGDFYYGEPGYEVQRRVTRLVERGKADVGEEEWSRLTARLERILAPPDAPNADARARLVRGALDRLAVGDLIVIRELEDAYAARPGRSPAEVWHDLTETQRNAEHGWRRVCHGFWREVVGPDSNEAQGRRLRKAVLGPVCNHPFHRDHHHEESEPTEGEA